MFNNKNFWIALLIILLAVLPFIHDIIELPPGEFKGFSSRRVFLYMFSINLFSHLGWLLAFILAKDKPFRFSILIPVSLSLYQVIILITGLKDSSLNEATTKFIITVVLSFLVVIKFFTGKRSKIK